MQNESKNYGIIMRIKDEKQVYTYVLSDFRKDIFKSKSLKYCESFCKKNNYEFIYSFK